MNTETTQVDRIQSSHPQNLPALMNSSMSIKHHSYVLKKSLQLLITLSLFSLLICLSWANSTASNSSSSYVVVYLNPLFFSSFFTHTLERKYMFLICNGILAFLATTSTRNTTSSSSGSDHHHHRDEIEEVDSVARCDLQGNQDAAMFEGGTEEEETEESRELGEGDEDDGSKNDAEEEEEEEVEDEDCGDYNDEVEEEVKEGGKSEEEMMGNCSSTEELNRKIEDFIRKMKEEMRIESQQPLVAAV